MARPLYPHELGDPDFFWLISSFREKNPTYVLLEIPSLPVVLISEERQEQSSLELLARDIEDKTTESNVQGSE